MFQTFAVTSFGQEYYNVPLSSAKYFDNHITSSAAVDSIGNLWVGTEKGLYRFDGAQAIEASYLLENWGDLKSSYVNDIQCDQLGRLWINTKTQGIAVIDIANMHCVRVPIRNKEGIEFFDYNIQSIIVDEDFVWASLWSSNEFEGGLLRISLADMSAGITPLKDIIVPGALHNDLQNLNTLWITGESLIKFDKKQNTYQEIEYDKNINAEHLISITENTLGELYISFRNAEDNNRTTKVLRFDKKKSAFLDTPILGNLTFSINYMRMFNDSLLLMTSNDEPYYQMYNTYANEWIEWELKNDLIKGNGKILSLINGSKVITGNNINYLNRKADVFNSIPLKVDDNNDSYFGNGHFINKGYLFPQLGKRDYIYRLDTSENIISKIKLDESFNYRALYKIDREKSLAVAREAIVIIDRSNGQVDILKHISDYVPYDNATKLFFNSSVDRKGNVWIATSHNSVLKYDIDKGSLEDYKMPTWDQDSPIFVFDVVSDENGNVMVAGRFDVFYKSEEEDTFVLLKDRFPDMQLPKNVIPYSLNTIEANEFLLGTWAKGIYRIELNEKKAIRVGPEINNVFVESIRALDDNKFAFLGKDYLAFYNSENNHYRILKEKHGIETLPFRNPICFSINSNEAISFNGELRIFDVENLLLGRDQRINISRISVNGNVYDIKHRIELDHDENNIEIDYALSEIDIYNQVKYKYSLSSSDPNWVEVGSKKNLMFTNLKPGNYSFRILSTSIDGFWIDNQKSIDLIINPPWYLTWWAKALWIFLCLLLLFILTKIYVNYQKRNLEYDKRFAQLETMILKSQMNPHFIFNSLNSIRYLFMKDEKHKGLKYITKFAKLLRSTLHHGEEALVKLSEEIELTELYIELEQLRFEGKFEFVASYDEDYEWRNILVPPFVVQPLVENAFWHGLSQSKKENKELKIKVEKQDADWLIQVIDNGIGMSNSKPSLDKEVGKEKSYGLSILKERFELINSLGDHHYSLRIDSNSDIEGTTVTIEIKEVL